MILLVSFQFKNILKQKIKTIDKVSKIKQFKQLCKNKIKIIKKINFNQMFKNKTKNTNKRNKENSLEFVSLINYL